MKTELHEFNDSNRMAGRGVASMPVNRPGSQNASSFPGSGATWAVVLAAGDGTRLARLTTDRQGNAVPKQYCSLDGSHSLLDAALLRASKIAPAERTCIVVSSRHRKYWNASHGVVLAGQIIEQPQNRGTAHGILLAVLWILQRDPSAHIIFLPADHFIEDEPAFARSLRRAVSLLQRDHEGLLLMGVEPETPDPELGYIVPGIQRLDGRFNVDRFVEKPPVEMAGELLCLGAVWNTFVFGAPGQALLEMIRSRMPATVHAMTVALMHELRGRGDTHGLQWLYRHLDNADFSRGILEGQSNLTVLKAPACGWTDLGTPMRVGDTLKRLAPAVGHRNSTRRGHHHFINLATQHARLYATG